MRLSRTEIILFSSSIILHLVVSIFLYSQFGERVLVFENEDAGGYISLAKNIVAGDGFSRNGMPTAVRTPAYPLFLAGIYAVHLPPAWSVLILQNLMVGIAVVLLYRIGKMLFSERVGRIASVMYMIEPYMLMTANLATTETFFNFILVLFAYFFLRWYLRPSAHHTLSSRADPPAGGEVEGSVGVKTMPLRSSNEIHKSSTSSDFSTTLASSGRLASVEMTIAAALLGLATLVRPAALYAPGVVMVLLIIRWLYKKESWQWFVKNALVFCTMFIAVLSPWMIREYIRFGTPRITNIDSVMLYFRAAPLIVAEEENVSYTEAIQILWRRLQEKFPGVLPGDEYTDFRFYTYMVGTTKELLARHPSLVFRTYAVSAIPALFGTGYEYMLTDVFGLERATVRVSYSEILLKQGSAALLKQFLQPDLFQTVLLVSLLLWTVAYILILNLILRPLTWRRHAHPPASPSGYAGQAAPLSYPPEDGSALGGKGEGSYVLALFFLLGFTAYFVLVTLGPAVHVRYRMPTFPWLFLLAALGIDFLWKKEYKMGTRIKRIERVLTNKK